MKLTQAKAWKDPVLKLIIGKAYADLSITFRTKTLQEYAYATHCEAHIEFINENRSVIGECLASKFPKYRLFGVDADGDKSGDIRKGFKSKTVGFVRISEDCPDNAYVGDQAMTLHRGIASGFEGSHNRTAEILEDDTDEVRPRMTIEVTRPPSLDPRPEPTSGAIADMRKGMK